MPGNFNRPQFVLPYTFTSNMTVELVFTSALAPAVTLTLNVGGSLTRRNNRLGLASSDLLTWISTEMNSEDTDGTWTSSEAPGSILGRARLTNSSRSDGLTVNQVTFGGSLSGTMLGYASDVVSVANPLEIDGPFVRGRLWIPHSDSVTPVCMIDDARDELTIVESVTPSTKVTQDLYGTTTVRRILVSPIDSPFIKKRYADDSAFLLTGMTQHDPNAPFDRFCAEWVALTGESKKCRFYPEAPDATTGLPTYNVNVLPMAEWLANVENAAETISEAPLLYQLDIECWEV